MSRLMSRLRQGDHRGDRGAVTTLVAILLGGGLLLGGGALVIDIGRLYSERAQLQNASDAAALALAQVCADGSADCGNPLAVSYADANSNDNTSTVDVVCGADDHGLLAVCPDDDAEAAGCNGERPTGTDFVEVRTSTRQADGATLLPATFGQVLLGADYEGRGVSSCTRVAWGGPSAAYGFGVTISLCEWETATAEGTSFAPESGVVPATFERVLKLHTTSGTTCPRGPSGWITPGGFGWLADATGNCQAYVDINGVYQGDTGVSASTACKEEVVQARTDERIVLMPVYDGAGGTGHEGYFHLKGFASFVITGYNLPGLKAASSLTNQKHCNGEDKCLYGYFTNSLLPADAVLGGPDLGATAVRVVG